MDRITLLDFVSDDPKVKAEILRTMTEGDRRQVGDAYRGGYDVAPVALSFPARLAILVIGGVWMPPTI